MSRGKRQTEFILIKTGPVTVSESIQWPLPVVVYYRSESLGGLRPGSGTLGARSQGTDAAECEATVANTVPQAETE